MFCPVMWPWLGASQGQWPLRGADHGKSPPGLLLPPWGENMGQEKKCQSKPDRFQSDPNSFFSQKRPSFKLSGKSADTLQASTEHPLRATQRGSQWSRQAVYVYTQPSPAGLRAEAPPWGKGRSVEEQFRPRPKAGELQAESGTALKATRAAESRSHGAKSQRGSSRDLQGREWQEQGSTQTSGCLMEDSQPGAQPGAAASPGGGTEEQQAERALGWASRLRP